MNKGQTGRKCSECHDPAMWLYDGFDSHTLHNFIAMIITKQNEGKLEFYWDNGCYIGHAYIGDDGFYAYEFEHGGGSWEAHALRAIADKLDELNKPWDDQIKKYFENGKKRTRKSKRSV